MYIFMIGKLYVTGRKNADECIDIASLYMYVLEKRRKNNMKILNA